MRLCVLPSLVGVEVFNVLYLKYTMCIKLQSLPHSAIVRSPSGQYQKPIFRPLPLHSASPYQQCTHNFTKIAAANKGLLYASVFNQIAIIITVARNMQQRTTRQGGLFE